VLLDEPTDGMDASGRVDMLELITRLRRELGVDVLLSTHILADVERVCDHLVMLAGGRVLAAGELAEFVGSALPTYELELADNGEHVRDALREVGLGVTLRADGRLLARGSGGRAATLIRNIAAERGWPLRRLVAHTPSLEESFVRLARGATPETLDLGLP
jgi:ABC-2 type transport system ATP-binding protein